MPPPIFKRWSGYSQVEKLLCAAPTGLKGFYSPPLGPCPFVTGFEVLRTVEAKRREGRD